MAYKSGHRARGSCPSPRGIFAAPLVRALILEAVCRSGDGFSAPPPPPGRSIDRRRSWLQAEAFYLGASFLLAIVLASGVWPGSRAKKSPQGFFSGVLRCAKHLSAPPPLLAEAGGIGGGCSSLNVLYEK